MRAYRGVGICTILAAGMLCGWLRAETPAERNAIEDQEINIFIKGDMKSGKPVLPATATEFKIKLTDTGDVIGFRWADLEESERNRVQKIYGLEVKDDVLVFGNKIKGMRYLLDSGKQIEGYPLPERSRDGEIALRTAGTPYMSILAREVKSQEVIEREESYFFSAREVYERRLLEAPPSSENAAGHLEFARLAGNMGLFREALDHLTKAEIIDPRTVERNKEFREQLIVKHAEQEGMKLYLQLVKAVQTGDFFAALDVLDRLGRGFPNHSYRSRWDALRTQIEDGCKTDLKRKVVQLSYIIANELIQTKLSKKVKVDDRGNAVPALPAKLVTTKHNRIFRGALVSPDQEGDLVITLWDPAQKRMSNTTLTIKGKEVLSVEDVDLSAGAKEISATFDDLKQYVTDTGGQKGLQAQMVTRIVQLLKGAPGVSEASVKEIFASRLQKSGTVDDDGNLVLGRTHATLHSASYGKGSWLREGSRIMAYNGPAVNPSRLNPNRVTAASEAENPDISDDPNIWWKYQSYETQFAVLRAFASEKIFSVRYMSRLACKSCGGKGTVRSIGPGGNAIDLRCAGCRGMGVQFGIEYE